MLLNICGALVYKRSDPTQILTILRKKSPYKGYLALPGGKIEEGETLEQATRREIYEETGIRSESILNVKYLGLLNELFFHNNEFIHQFVVNYFVFESEDVELKSNDEEGEVQWMDIEEIVKNSRFLPSDQKFVEFVRNNGYETQKWLCVEGVLLNQGTREKEDLILKSWNEY